MIHRGHRRRLRRRRRRSRPCNAASKRAKQHRRRLPRRRCDRSGSSAGGRERDRGWSSRGTWTQLHRGSRRGEIVFLRDATTEWHGGGCARVAIGRVEPEQRATFLPLLPRGSLLRCPGGCGGALLLQAFILLHPFLPTLLHEPQGLSRAPRVDGVGAHPARAVLSDAGAGGGDCCGAGCIGLWRCATRRRRRGCHRSPRPPPRRRRRRRRYVRHPRHHRRHARRKLFPRARGSRPGSRAAEGAEGAQADPAGQVCPARHAG